MSFLAEEKLAIRAAEAAAAIQRARPAQLGVSRKGAVDLVTEVDLASEQAIREILSAATPEVPILGEEGGGGVGASTRWVVDPLDGTTNFVHGLPHFGPSIALEVEGEPVVGVSFDVCRGELFHGSRGAGAWMGDTRLSVSAVDTLDEALVATGFPYDRRQRAAFYLRRVQRVLETCQGVRRPGAATLDLGSRRGGSTPSGSTTWAGGTWLLGVSSSPRPEAAWRPCRAATWAIGPRPWPPTATSTTPSGPCWRA